jgi:hypothetical protein
VNAVTVSSGVPADYEELARLYTGDIRVVVRRRVPWAQPADVDEIVSYILAQVQPQPPRGARPARPGAIEQFNPDYVSDKTGGHVSFRSFLLAKVPAYARGKSERIATIGNREVLTADAPAGDGSVTWIETIAEQPVDVSGLGDGAALQRMREVLAAKGEQPGQAGLLALFDDLAARVDSGQPVTEKALARTWKTTPDGAASRLQQLREELRAVVARDYRSARDGGIRLGGRWLDPAQVREAATLLKTAPGNQVVKVWERAGHPLGTAGKTWYLDLARAELEAYPFLRGAKGGHFDGGHGSPVKRGLIHYLDRIAGEAELAAPAPLSPAWQAVAEALTALPGALPEQVADALAVLEEIFA